MRAKLIAALTALCALAACDLPLPEPQEPREPVSPTAEPSAPTVPTPPTPPPPGGLTDCEAACLRWETEDCKAGFAVCDGYDEAGDCVEYVSCEIACRREPHAYPAAACVAELPRGLTCAEMEESCGR